MAGATARLNAIARAQVEARLRERPPLPVDQWAQGITEEEKARRMRVIEDLSRVIGVAPQQLRPDDRLDEVLRVSRSSLPEPAQRDMTSLGLREVFDPYAFALLDFVERRVGEDRTRLSRESFQPTPKSESEWVDRILRLTVGELAEALA
jgi:hypothetical protein